MTIATARAERDGDTTDPLDCLGSRLHSGGSFCPSVQRINGRAVVSLGASLSRNALRSYTQQTRQLASFASSAAIPHRARPSLCAASGSSLFKPSRPPRRSISFWRRHLRRLCHPRRGEWPHGLTASDIGCFSYPRLRRRALSEWRKVLFHPCDVPVIHRPRRLT